MTFTEQLSNLTKETEQEFNSILEKNPIFNFVTSILEEYEGLEKEIVTQLIKEENYNELYEYDFQEFLSQLYYNGRHGSAKMCYLLRVDKEQGLYVLDAETSNTFFISFSDLNGIYYKIEVVEKMQNN